MTSADQAVWLYAITREGECSLPPSARGIADEDVRVLTEAGLTAVIGSVDRQRFGPDVLARNLENLDWLAETARVHDAVVAAVAAGGPVVPVRLATMFSSEKGVRELLRERRDDLSAALDAVTGRTEWGVKAYVDPDALADALSDKAAHAAPRDAATDQPRRGSGSAYLMRRSAQMAARQTAENTADEWAQQMHAELRRMSTASRLHPAQDPRLTGRRDWMILNAAYLVDQDRTGAFHALVDQFTNWQQGLEVQLTGPWPPYSFAVAPGERHG
jgi:hypothetical protein